MNTLLRFIEANGLNSQTIESLPASKLDHLLSIFFLRRYASPHVTESTEVLDSGFHPSGFRIPPLWIHWIPDSKPLDSGFQ